MLKTPPVAHRIAYCLVILGAILPFGVAPSRWVAHARGLSSTMPFIDPVLLAALGIFRVYLVAHFPATLSSLPASGVAAALRMLGLIGIYIGVVATILSLMHTFLTSRTESGAEFFMAGVYLSLIGSSGLLGIFLFEFSRLLSFEKLAYERHIGKKEA